MGAVDKSKNPVQYEHTFVRATGISSVDECDTSLFRESKKEWQKWTWHVLRQTVWSTTQYSGKRRRGACHFQIQGNPSHSKPLRRCRQHIPSTRWYLQPGTNFAVLDAVKICGRKRGRNTFYRSREHVILYVFIESFPHKLHPARKELPRTLSRS
jgi:hypothetical protein